MFRQYKQRENDIYRREYFIYVISMI